MYLSLKELWNNVLEILESELSEIGFMTWLKPLEPVSLKDETISIIVDSVFMKDMLESKYISLIENAILISTGNKHKVVFLLPNQQESSEKNVDYNNINKPTSNNFALNPEYTFSKFVIGSNNRFAHAAAVAVAESPSNAYNPLFLYGESGLGKTHLMHAIGHFISENNKKKKVMYVQSENFTNEFINAIKNNTSQKFREKYRKIDVLLMDDIQFIAGKKQTQEEFFHTFLTLYENKKQIVISSDKPPHKIETLEDRLKTRFESGLITDIASPDYETRIAILRKKSLDENIVVPDEVLEYISKNFVSNIRILQGALTRIIAYASLVDGIITLKLTETVLKDIINKQNEEEISIPIIITVVSKYFGITPKEMTSKTRSRNIAYPRQIAMYISRKHTNTSLPRIGKQFGGRDHSTVIHACDKIKTSIKRDKEVNRHVEEIERLISV